MLAEVERLTYALEASEGIRRVDSIASVPVIRGTPDGSLKLDPALDGDRTAGEDGAARARLAIEGDRIAPVSAPEHIATKRLRVVTVNQVPAGWTFYGELPLQLGAAEDVSHPAIGWIFSEQLHARLKLLQRSARDPDRVAGLNDPFAIEVEAAAKAVGNEPKAPASQLPQ